MAQFLPEEPRKRRTSRTVLVGGIAVLVSVVLATIGIGASDSLEGSLVGAFLNDKTDTRCPQGMAFVNAADGFCIDRYEAVPGAGCLFRDPASSSETQINLDAQDCSPASEPMKIPWRFISQHQATLACAKAGKHLATNREWYAAALGTPDTDLCNTENDEEASMLTAALPDCTSSAGAHDMIGNLWEWTDAVVVDGKLDGIALSKSGFVTAVDSAGIPLLTDGQKRDPAFYGDRLWLNPKGAQGIVRGGYFGSGTEGGIYSVYAASPPTIVSNTIGFRCAS